MATSSKLLAAGVVMTVVVVAITTFRQAAENEKLRREVATLAASIQRAQEAPPAATVRVYEKHTVVEKSDAPAPREAEAPAAMSKEARVELAARVNDAVPQLLDRRFSSESRDREWAARTEKRIGSAIEAVHVPGAELTDVECHQSVCRASGKFDSKEHFNRMMFGLFSPSDGAPPLADHASRVPPLEEGPDGKFYTSVYMFREGVEFDPVAEYQRSQ